MSTPHITIKNLSSTLTSQSNHKSPVLKDINLTVNRGEFLVLLGPSGCGKSTFLRILAGLEPGYHGEITFDKKTNISFVFQDFGLLPWLTVEENIALGLISKCVPLEDRKKKVKDIIGRFGLTGFGHYKPKEISGGMKQRVGLARAFATEPDIILLDEPFSELDFYTARQLRGELSNLWKEHQATIIMVSHYVEDAVELGDHVGVFSPHPGTIKVVMKNDLPRPRDARSKEFFEMEDKILSHFT